MYGLPMYYLIRRMVSIEHTAVNCDDNHLELDLVLDLRRIRIQDQGPRENISDWRDRWSRVRWPWRRGVNLGPFIAYASLSAMASDMDKERTMQRKSLSQTRADASRPRVTCRAVAAR